MKLIELNPKYGSEGDVRNHVVFDCPKCQKHRICVPIPPTAQEPVWKVTGDSFENLSLSPSILHKASAYGDGPCESHFFVTNGEIKMC